MEESKRQKQVARLIQEEMSDILQKHGLSIYKGGLVTVSNVLMTVDLSVARIYISIYNSQSPEELVEALQKNVKELRYDLGKRMRHQLRMIPHLNFFLDDTMDHIERMNQVFKEIKQDNNDTEEE